MEKLIAPALCACGCGRETRIASVTRGARGQVKGQPLAYINGHNRRKHSLAYELDERTGCWNWLGSVTWNGYGQGVRNAKHFLAHRYFYEQERGPIPRGVHLDHLCRNRRCCNPDHLEQISNRENARRGNATILQRQQVQEIKRASYYRGLNRDLAERYGVARCTISAIRCGRLWPDVT